MSEPSEAFTTNELLILLGRHVRAIRASVGIVAFVAFIQLVLIACWIVGIVVVEFDESGG